MRETACLKLRSVLAATAIVSACLSAVPTLAGAQGNAVAPAGSPPTVERNIYAAGGNVRPGAPVDGDFVAAGGKVIVDQRIAGDAALAGGSVSVRAPVGDDLRAVGGDVSVESAVGGELFAAGANIDLAQQATVRRGARLYGSNVTVEGRVEGDLRATARSITVNGEVRGDARLVAEQIELGPNARIGGALTYVSRAGLKKAEGATIGGAVTREPEAGPRGTATDRQMGRSWRAPSWFGGGMSFLALLASAALFLLVVPGFGANAAQRLRATPWHALGVGVATVLALPVVAVLLFVTVLGIPLGIALLALYPAVMLAGFVVGVHCIGGMLAVALRKPPPVTFAGNMGWFAVALLLALVVSNLPVVGPLLAALLGVAGIGACVMELQGRRKPPEEGAPAGRPILSTRAEAG